MEPKNTLDDFRVEQNVELHPATDRWMMGDRFGRVTSIDRKKGHVILKMDRSGKRFRFLPDNILTEKTRNP